MKQILKNIIIIGAGGLAKDLYSPLTASLDKSYRIKGILADDRKKFLCSHIPAPYLGAIQTYQPTSDDYFIIAFGTQPIRATIFQDFKARGARFFSFIHPSVILPRNCHIGEGVLLGAHCIVGEDSYIDDNVFANKFVNIGHGSFIGSSSILCPYVMISGGARVGKNSFLATRVSLAPNTCIGNHCVVSAHSFVRHNISDSMFVYPQNKLLQRKI